MLFHLSKMRESLEYKSELNATKIEELSDRFSLQRLTPNKPMCNGVKATIIIGDDESDNSEKSRFQVPATPGLEPWRPGLVLVALLVNI